MSVQPRPREQDVGNIVLEPADNQRLANLCGALDQHLRQVERSLGVEINNRGNSFRVRGEERPVRAAGEIIRQLYESTRDEALTPARVHLFLQDAGVEAVLGEEAPLEISVRTRRGVIKTRGRNQGLYIQRIQRHDINFGIGPAGTGKTYLAVACAVESLESERVRRVVLVRPAVEAGERLGFLPGDLAQKIDPYLRPLYDALYEMLGFERVTKLVERNIIEIAPLAYMRGRTLNESFIILDEAQNTTVEQMKMFLTRIGFGATALVTGDVTQVDLPRGQRSGLRHVMDVLKSVDGISFTHFTSKDVVRHPLVARILDAYEAYEQNDPEQMDQGRIGPGQNDNKSRPTLSYVNLSIDVQYAWDAQSAPTESQLQVWTAAAVADRSGEAEMTVRIVDEKEGAELNRQYRGGDRATNVLSFPFEAPPGVTHPLLGDVVVCGPVVIREAHEQAKTSEAHWAHMVVHGTLHLLGFDHQHEVEAKRMESRELSILAQLGFPDPYCNSSLP